MNITDVSQFWRPFEEEVDSFESLRNWIHGVFDHWAAEGRLFAWRGMVDARWPLHSSLFRRLYWTNPQKPPTEQSLYKKEGAGLVELHRWGLHQGQSGRLSILSQLAKMQHYGAPTRLIDVTFNPYIGAWFAVEAKTKSAEPEYEDVDGRLVVVDVTERLINENDNRDWEDDLKRPWRPDNRPDSWCISTFAWRPSRFEDRIAAQNGGFLLGGVPKTIGGSGRRVHYPKTTNAAADGMWKIDEVRAATSVPLRMHKPMIRGGAGAPPQNPAYTLRIKAAAKSEIREKLERLFGYTHATIYPDFPGLADFGFPDLRTAPP